MNLNKFKIMHSELICYFQLIENDLKWIYAAMVEGKTYNNRMKVSKLSLTQILIELKELDHSDKTPLISMDEYRYLGDMFQKRNFWCHEAYVEISYLKGFRYKRAYSKLSRELKEDYKIFKNLHQRISELKEEAIDIYC